MFLAIPHDPTLKALEDQKFGDKDLNGFSVLINGDIAHANRRLVRLGSRRNDFDDLALNMQGVASIGSMNPLQPLRLRIPAQRPLVQKRHLPAAYRKVVPL